MTGVQIDSSCLPPVQEVCRDFAVLEDGAFAYCLQEQEIEQHYASNVQRNQLVQKDLQVAKTLQAVEDGVGQLCISQDKKEEQSKERDPSFLLLHPIQDEAHWKGPEPPQREERDQDHAQQMEEEEEEEEEVTQKEQLQRSLGRPGTGTEPVTWLRGLDEAPQSPEQVRQDEELAWRLQEKEHARAARARRNRERNDDYRVAQVAQDEEIARYIQDQELKEQWKRPSEDPEAKGMSGREGDRPESRGQEEETPWQKGGRAAPQVVRVTPLKRPQDSGKGSPTVTPTRLTQFCRNIAEELDPTFRAKGLTRLPAAEVTTTRSRVVAPVHPVVPVDGLFDYVEELAGPAFVSPTKQQPEKVGHLKPREKRDGGCKHQ